MVPNKLLAKLEAKNRQFCCEAGMAGNMMWPQGGGEMMWETGMWQERKVHIIQSTLDWCHLLYRTLRGSVLRPALWDFPFISGHRNRALKFCSSEWQQRKLFPETLATGTDLGGTFGKASKPYCTLKGFTGWQDRRSCCRTCLLLL